MCSSTFKTPEENLALAMPSPASALAQRSWGGEGGYLCLAGGIQPLAGPSLSGTSERFGAFSLLYALLFQGPWLPHPWGASSIPGTGCAGCAPCLSVPPLRSGTVEEAADLNYIPAKTDVFLCPLQDHSHRLFSTQKRVSCFPPFLSVWKWAWRTGVVTQASG